MIKVEVDSMEQALKAAENAWQYTTLIHFLVKLCPHMRTAADEAKMTISVRIEL